MATRKGYINGSDLLLNIGDKAVGHCTSHKITYNIETKERAVKPLEGEPRSTNLWKEKVVVGLSISVSAEGLRFYKEAESGFEEIGANWGKGQAVRLTAYPRRLSESDKLAPYLEGNFVITSIEEDSPAQDDATYSVSLENSGMPDTYMGRGLTYRPITTDDGKKALVTDGGTIVTTDLV